MMKENLNRKAKCWSEQEISFLIRNYGKIPTKEIASYLKRTVNGVLWKASNMRDILKPLKSEKKWTDEEDDYLRNYYKYKTNREIAKDLNRTLASIKGRNQFLQLRKSENRGKYKKGNVPFNKGTKGLMKPNKTSFKKGNIPHNTKYDGCVTIRRDTKTGREYKYIRLSLGVWREYHRQLWEDFIGPIPPGGVVRFIDGYSLNCSLDNLMLITKKKNLEYNNRSDARIAAYLANGNKELKEIYLMNPDLIELKRQSIYLARSIKNGIRKKAG